MDRVAEDVVCRAPGEDLAGKDAYREYLASFAPALTGLADAATFAEEDRVALFYYPQTAATSTALAPPSASPSAGTRSSRTCSSSTACPSARRTSSRGLVTLPPDRTRLPDRIRALLEAKSPTREVPMFGGVSFMVNEKMVASVRSDGDLLVRVDPERSAELVTRDGARPAEMGAGRPMGAGWIDVAHEAIAADEQLSFWIEVALEYNEVSQ